jgi:hypothetical protein
LALQIEASPEKLNGNEEGPGKEKTRFMINGFSDFLVRAWDIPSNHTQ